MHARLEVKFTRFPREGGLEGYGLRSFSPQFGALFLRAEVVFMARVLARFFGGCEDAWESDS